MFIILISALTNPDFDIFLTYFREVGYYNETRLPLIDAISSYNNVYLRQANIYEYSKDTPLEEWMNKGVLFSSFYLLTHTSDILRMLTLWKFTGTYLDLDVILRKPIDFGKNLACIQKDGLINSAILNLDESFGRSIADDFFNHTISSFQPKGWVDNGPQVLTNIVKSMCNTANIHNMTRQNCNGFLVLEPKLCYEIDYREWQHFFLEESSQLVMNRTNNSFAVHFWNYLNSGQNLSKHSTAAYIRIAQQFCPKVLKAADDNW